MSSSCSDKLIRALRQPGIVADAAAEVSLLETHISWVLLAGPWALKIKKPVSLGFLDFSSLEKRRFYCEEELRLNRRLAADLYLEVVPITGTPDAPRLGGPGEAIEFAVRMKRFPQEALLASVLDRGELGPRHIDQLARAVADFHGSVERAPPGSHFGEPARVLVPPQDNLAYLRRLVSEPPRKAQLERLQRWTEDEFARRRPDLAARRRDGFVRECHGDLHLGNMVLLDDAVRVFDCIEFNDDFRWIDVISDVAFATMDLEHRGRADFAGRFLNAYLERTGDYGGLAVLPFYVVYRALVRALVDVIRSGQLQRGSGARRELDEEFHSYLDLAERWIQPRRPSLTITFGVSGSGKTTGTQPLVEREGAVRLRSDVERKRLFGLRPDEASGTAGRPDIYSRQATDRTYRRLEECAAAIVRSGFPAVVDATFLNRRRRQRFKALADRLGVPFRIAEFASDEATLRQRIEERRREGHDASEATAAVLADQLKAREPLADDERAYVM
jgi:aminoglycoside phosphotransferase family enzyme/predicted kinase